MSGPRGALDGIKVIDCSSYLAGPYAAMMLADLGASVIKVEALEGDSFRELPGFYGWNRGKRSIAVNLKDPAGRDILHRLVKTADVLLQNMRPGVDARLGMDSATLRKMNPRLIYCAMTAFGPDGPYRDRPGYDPVFQALGGVQHLQGFGGPPQFVRVAVTDYYTAALGAQAVLAALFVRERTGHGQHVETSLLQGVLALQSGSVVDYPGKPTFLRETPTYRLYQAGDREWFFLACGNQSFWAKLCKAVGRPDMTDDPRFGSWLLRGENRDTLMPILESIFATKSRSEWLAILTDHDIPCAPVQSLPEFMRDPGVQHLKMTVQYDHPEVGKLTLMGQPIRFSETQAPDAGPPPALGQHTRAILREAGYGDGDIADLHRRGIIAGKDL
ncbi:MAG TPA: CoA transferase [Candidatus Bathyarchaeia archaeon]|nr:CoA transferase [Candidatus Bathyarchaeia archaeon]